MKKGGVINSSISRAIAQTGHFDKLSIKDAGMSVPSGTEEIDLTASNGLPSSLSVLENVLEGLEVQSIKLTREIKTTNSKILEKIRLLLPGTPISFIPHEEIKKSLNSCHIFIRTGKMTSCANIVLVSEVVF